MLREVVRRRRRRWAHAPVIYAASHFYHEKRVAWVSISIHTCDPVPIVMGLRYYMWGTLYMRILEELSIKPRQPKGIGLYQFQFIFRIPYIREVGQ